jgi:serine/threonine-protein kinase
METPKKIGKYSIVKQVGEGAMSNVYLALDESMRTVAIKVLKNACRTEKHLKMFKSEVDISLKMDHPNIVKVFDFDIDECYLVMSYIEGISLSAYDDVKTLLPVADVLLVIGQVARALKHAAEHGVVHRDIKPGNIIITKNKDIRVTDFGCAVPAGEKPFLVAGSLAYMSPEQIEGEIIDFHSDIYALGALAFRLLTGHNPIDLSDGAKIAILHFKPRKMSDYREHIPSSLSNLIYKALDKYELNRQKTWDCFLNELNQAQADVRNSKEDIDSFRGLSFNIQRWFSSITTPKERESFSNSALSKSRFY